MKKLSAKRQAKSRKPWVSRAVNVVGAVAVTLAIMWEIGMMSPRWWEWFTEPKPIPVAKAPERPSTKPIGIAPVAPRGNDSSVSPVPLQLILVAAHPGRGINDGSAEIGVVRESPQTYQAGAVLENGARLAEIHNNFVLLRKGTHSARLYLEDVRAAGAIGDTAMLAVGGVTDAPPPAPVTSREILTDYIRPSPVYEGDNVVGFQIYPGANGTAFSQMGLQAGDVLVEVNDVPLTDPAVAWDLLRQLNDGISLVGIVRRKGAFEHVTLDGALIVRAEEERKRPPQAMLAPGNL
jgi:PDZ domain